MNALLKTAKGAQEHANRPALQPSGDPDKEPFGTFAYSVLCLVSGLTGPSDRLLNCLSIGKEKVERTEVSRSRRRNT